MTPPDFRAAIIASMTAREMNAKQLADRSDVGYASVYDFVKGKGGLTADNLAKLCGVLGIGLKVPKVR